jgi:predicted DCC family thiol-disulfide oxidoreductase YuxK
MKPLNGIVTNILRGNQAQVLCDATVDLISKVQRPWLFRVTVKGLPPHLHTRVYDIAARDDNTAALTAMDRFVKEMSWIPEILLL